MAEFEKLVKAAKKQKYLWPTSKNRIACVAECERERVVAHAHNTYPIMHFRVNALMKDFLKIKTTLGSTVEKKLYDGMSVDQLAHRLLTKRPLMFMTGIDQFVLKDGQDGAAGRDLDEGFCLIGKDTEQSPLLLKDLMSYDEMQIAALVGVSVPTHFINRGGRGNQGRPAKAGTFEPTGVYVGQVGARFERPHLMEWQHMMVDCEQNTAANGYGAEADASSERTALLRAWAKLYAPALGCSEVFPAIDEIQDELKESDGAYIQLPRGHSLFLNQRIFKERLRLAVEPFLLDASHRAQAEGKQAYCHIVGLGLGVWAVHLRQKELMLQVYHEALTCLDLPGISNVDFSWFKDCDNLGGVASGHTLAEGPNSSRITIAFSKRDPAAPLEGQDAGKLLVAQYAWDSNAYPGNEYWADLLSASGDPAAACCSHITELQNPDVNARVCGGNARVLGGGFSDPTVIKDL